MEKGRSSYPRISRGRSDFRRRVMGQGRSLRAEKFISQCTICGLLLAFLLFVRFINIPLAIQLRGEIKEVLAVNPGSDNFSELSENIRDSFDSLRARILGGGSNDDYMFDSTDAEISLPAVAPDASGLGDGNIGNGSGNVVGEENISSMEIFHIDHSSGIRIDEDILNDIDARERFLIR